MSRNKGQAMSKTISRKRVDATEAGPTPTTTIKLPAGDVPDVPMYYANNTSVETTLWDVCLRFAETIETDREANIIKVREVARVRMSLQHARVIVGILNQHLERYEHDYGAIPGPRGASDPHQELKLDK